MVIVGGKGGRRGLMGNEKNTVKIFKSKRAYAVLYKTLRNKSYSTQIFIFSYHLPING